ncbi:MAG TPA: ABC transporter ATP-binding protein [Chloroflexota bacterium]|nr:ABC transporter ATP-binding protein [Chloroflexota bacterium]
MSDSNTEVAIHLQGVSKSFGSVRAVIDAQLEIREGEFFSLLGPSGCGKTTTLRMLAGFEYPDSGSIHLRGEDVTHVAPNKRPVNMVFQNYELFPHMSVFDNVAYGLKVRKTPKEEIAGRVSEMLETVGVGGLENRGADQLSGGQQQRVALARALVNRPMVLLLDEPLSALDVKLRKHMQLELKSMQNELGTTFVYVTHDQEEALLMSDRIGIMNDGRLLQVGTAREIYERPSTAFVADFVGTLNAFDFRVDELDGDVAVMRPNASDVIPMQIAPRPATGDTVHAAVRPERIEIVAAGDSRDDDARLNGVVANQIYLGPTTQYLVETSVGQIVAQLVSSGQREDLAAGKPVTLYWPIDAAFAIEEDLSSE